LDADSYAVLVKVPELLNILMRMRSFKLVSDKRYRESTELSDELAHQNI